jgi:hypothetical protein
MKKAIIEPGQIFSKVCNFHHTAALVYTMLSLISCLFHYLHACFLNHYAKECSVLTKEFIFNIFSSIPEELKSLSFPFEFWMTL